MKHLIFGLLLLVFASGAKHQKQYDTCISKEELKLYELLMNYRKTKGLPEIPLSKSMTFVARSHAYDLQVNQPDKGRCNMHSWSSKGKWKACCYTDDHAKAECMWSKPAELTNYTGDGFEISAFKSDVMSAEDALRIWKASKAHHDVIINAGQWKQKWNAIGIGINGKYAVVWFGNDVDPDGKATGCSE